MLNEKALFKYSIIGWQKLRPEDYQSWAEIELTDSSKLKLESVNIEKISNEHTIVYWMNRCPIVLRNADIVKLKVHDKPLKAR